MHVVVLGAGYAGLTLARRLERKLPTSVELTLVNDSPDHLVQHELHRVVRRPELAEEITVALTDVLERAAVHVAHVEEIDRDERVVETSTGPIGYDVAAICLGAETAYYGLPGVREHATPLKRLHHANRIRSDLLAALEGDDPRIVVGGAGLSGVQVAGEIAELVREEERNASVTILEQFDQVAPAFPPNFQRAVERTLTGLGIDVRTGTTVTGADETHLRVDGGELMRYDQLVWTGGIRGPDALDRERPVVQSDLRLDDRTFVVGDAARVVDDSGEPVPASAQSAVRGARVVADNVARLVEAADDESDGRELFEPRLEGFSFTSPGWIVSVGDDAVAQVGPAVVTGRAAKALKTTVGVGYLSSVGAIGTAVDHVRGEFEHGRR